MAEPVITINDGINFKPELMEKEKLYHCIYKDKVILVYKDQQDFLNCFEIEEPELVQKIKSGNNEDIDIILEDYIANMNLKTK
jgi:hypothetical protein